MISFRTWLIGSLVVAVLAWALPWLTHFADGGISILLLVLWFASIVAGLIRFRRRGLWLLLGAPAALFWVFAIFLVADDLKLSF
jgi:hypothetical protein